MSRVSFFGVSVPSRTVACGFAVVVVTTALLVWSEYQHLASGALIQDDGWWIGVPLVRGEVATPSSYRLFHEAIYFAAAVGSPVALRLALVLLHAFAACGLFFIFLRIQTSAIVAAIGSVSIMTLPIFSGQHIFISASHSLAALPVAMVSLLALVNTGSGGQLRRSIMLIVLTGGMILATKISPIYSLAPLLVVLGPPIFLGFRNWLPLPLIVYVASSSAVVYVLVDLLLLTPHVYTGLPGWTDISVDRLFGNLFRVWGLIWRRVTAGPAAVDMLLIVGSVLLLSALVLSALRRGRPIGVIAWRLFAVLMIASALTVAPAGFLTFISDRYCHTPTFFGASACLALFLTFLDGVRADRLAVVGLTCVSFANVGAMVTTQDSLHVQVAELHDEMQALVQREKDGWPEDSQVVLLIDGLTERHGPTNGFIHFSTGYLRYLSDRDDIVGLIGKLSSVDGEPFVATPNVFGTGPGYWATIKGKYQRLKMVGVRRDRPLFSYALDEQKRFQPVENVLFGPPDRLRLAPFGEVPAPVDSPEIDFCARQSQGSLVIWPGSIPSDHLRPASKIGSACPESFERNFLFDGKLSENVEFGPQMGDEVDLELRLSTRERLDARVTYSSSSPPMPALGTQFAIYRLGGKIQIIDRTDNSIYLEDASEDTTIRFRGVQGCNVGIYVNDNYLGALSSHSLSGGVTLGHGFLDRYWRGEMRVRYKQRAPRCE